jgi:molybdopterin converting factor small subunit
VATLRFFATAADAAGTRAYTSTSATVTLALRDARDAFGPQFGRVLDRSRIWLNGDAIDAATDQGCGPDDEIAVIPPVSGG